MIEISMAAKKANKIQKKDSKQKASIQKAKKPVNAKSKIVKGKSIVKATKAKAIKTAVTKQKVTKQVVTKPTPAKRAVVSSLPAKTEQVKSPSPKPTPLKEGFTKTIARAPMRKVIGTDRSLTVVEPRVVPENDPADVIITLKEDSILAPVLTIKPAPLAPVVAAPIVRLAWTALPKAFPPHIRFFVSMAEKECRSASTWPFPYAKFLSALPVKLCGKAFAAFLLWSDFDSEQVAKKLAIPTGELEQLVAGEGARMLEYFTETCPDMYRKLATQLGGVGVSIDLLAERYLVTKVDKDFQLMIAAMMLKLMSI